MNENKLIVFTGPMFSGKSGELLNAADRASHAREKIIAFLPFIDNRSATHIKSRFITYELQAFRIKHEIDIVTIINQEYEYAKFSSVTILFDEAQFFNIAIVSIIKKLLFNELFPDVKKSIYVSGLDLDAWRRTFSGEVMPVLMALADKVEKFTAICFKCHGNAIYTQKIGGSSDQVEIGDREIYEARCRSCHTIPK